MINSSIEHDMSGIRLWAIAIKGEIRARGKREGKKGEKREEKKGEKRGVIGYLRRGSKYVRFKGRNRLGFKCRGFIQLGRIRFGRRIGRLRGFEKLKANGYWI